MRLVGIFVIAGAWLGAELPIAAGAPARFWLSESMTNPVPLAPTINAVMNQPHTLYIWAQPETDGGDFRKLEDFSIDVVSLDPGLQPESAPFIDFIDGTFKVENPNVPTGMGSQQRFQYVTDSFRAAAQGGPLLSAHGAADILEFIIPDSIQGLQGIAPFASPATAGIGDNNDPYRFGAGSGSAWRVGEFSFQVLQSSGVNDLYLQIGWFGVRHEGDGQGTQPTPQTEVVFGTNSSPLYCNSTTSSSCYAQSSPDWSHRQTSLGGETFDVRINAVGSVPGDYNSDGSIGPADYTYWKERFGLMVTPGTSADGSGNGEIDAADYVLWRKLSSAGGNGTSVNDEFDAPNEVVVPEPSTIAHAILLVLLTLFAKGTQFRARHESGRY